MLCIKSNCGNSRRQREYVEQSKYDQEAIYKEIVDRISGSSIVSGNTGLLQRGRRRIKFVLALKLSGRNVLVAGDTGDIGLGIAEAFHRWGSKVIVCGRGTGEGCQQRQ